MAPAGDAASAFDSLQGALALATVLPSPASPLYRAPLPACSSSLPPTLLPFSPIAHDLLRASATTPSRLQLSSPVPSKQASPSQVLGRHLASARCFLLSFADEVVDAAVQHLEDVFFLLSTFGERMHLLIPMPCVESSPSSSSAPPSAFRDSAPCLLRHPSAAFAAIIPGDTVAELVVAQGIFTFLNLYNTVLIGRIILTWFPNAPAVIVEPLSTLCDPYLNLFRGIIPPIGGTLDLSPILAFVVLNVFMNASAALPAELPAAERGAAVGSSRSRAASVEMRRQMRLEKQVARRQEAEHLGKGEDCGV